MGNSLRVTPLPKKSDQAAVICDDLYTSVLVFVQMVKNWDSVKNDCIKMCLQDRKTISRLSK